jgi:hypothetical protein
MRWERYDQDITMRGAFGVQSISPIAPLWKVALTFETVGETDSGPYKALLMQLDGSRNQLELWDIGRPTPKGTIGTGGHVLTFNSTASAGATSIVIAATASPSGKTFKQGDMIGFGSGITKQVVMVMADATFGASTATVSVYPALRNSMTAGTSITYDKPKALFRQQVNIVGWDYTTVIADGMSLDLLEDVRP